MTSLSYLLDKVLIKTLIKMYSMTSYTRNTAFWYGFDSVQLRQTRNMVLSSYVMQIILKTCNELSYPLNKELRNTSSTRVKNQSNKLSDFIEVVFYSFLPLLSTKTDVTCKISVFFRYVTYVKNDRFIHELDALLSTN